MVPRATALGGVQGQRPLGGPGQRPNAGLRHTAPLCCTQPEHRRQHMSEEVATLGGGCFWCLEAVYKELRGVTAVMSGYAGGHVANPDYHHVCQGTTGHAEVVQVKFDPDQLSYADLLRVFFAIHDPTTLNRNG